MDDINLNAALRLASLGIAVFPCGQDKKPRPGIYWRNAATTNPATIEAWWRRWPDSLPAFEPGKHDLLAIDCDRHGGPDGVEVFAQLFQDNDDDPRDWPTVETPSTGRHIFFRNPDKLTNRRGALPAGIDVRGAGGFVIAEGAMLSDGRQYRTADRCIGFCDVLDGGGMPDLPGWLAAMLTAEKEVEHPPRAVTVQSPSNIDARGRAIAEKALAEDIAALASTSGNRNDATNGTAYRLGRMVTAGWIDRATVESQLEQACAANGLWKEDGPRQCRATIRSGIDSGMQAGAPPIADRSSPAITIDLPVAHALPAVVAEEEDDEADPEEALPISEDLTHVPGILGDVVDWITACGSTGNRVLALSAALPLMGTLLGRRMATPTRGGGALELYVITTMESGAGKGDGKNAVNRIFEKLGISNMHLGPTGFRSGAALSGHVCRFPLSLCVIDEIADEFANVLSGKSHMIDLEKTIKGVWGTGFASYRTEESLSNGAKTVHAPHLSIYGLTTRENLFNVIKSKDVTSGFINRFTVIDAGEKTRVEPTMNFRDPPMALMKSLASLYNMGARTDGNMASAGLIYKTVDGDPNPVVVPWASTSASECFRAFEDECDAAARDAGLMGKLYARSAFMAVKIATIRACGEFSPVTLDHMQWGSAIARQSAGMLLSNLKEHMVDPLSYPELFARIKQQFTMPSAKGAKLMEEYGPMTLPRKFLWENLKHHTGRNVFDFANSLKAMKENGEIGIATAINRRTHRSTECVAYLTAKRRKTA